MGAIVFFWQAHPKSRKLLLNLVSCHQGCLLSVAFCSGEALHISNIISWIKLHPSSCNFLYWLLYASLWYAAQRQSPALIIVQASVYL